MCGRVVVAMPRDVLAAELGVDEVVGPDLGRRWNVAPTNQLYAMAGRRSLARDTLARRLGTMSWGLLPSWATDPDSGPRPINARIESLGDRPHFAGALAARRCLVPVDGFYEWSSVNGTRQPYVLVPPDGSVLAIAAVWDRWAGPPNGGDAEPLVSCALVTTAANDDVAALHHRMPAFVERRHWDEWLDPDNRDEVALLELLRHPPVGTLVARPVSRLVNSTANDGPELLGEPEPEAPSLFPA
ncbi:MAG TPA: SOS response-associated peptidase [Acidimicrobiales bacterium]|nr:SOS response-associated peptidase [Acidimicrobiales bacterium]